MKYILFTALLICSFISSTFCQAVFQNHSSGKWNNPASWTLISGTSTLNYPSSADSAAITGANTITVDSNAQCNKLTVTSGGTLLLDSIAGILTVSSGLNVTSAGIINLNLGVITVTGNMSVTSASTITITQGALTVIGIVTINSPATAGTTLLDIEGGVFSCAGGITFLATPLPPSGRYAEMRIANGAVNIAGGLAAVTANGKINFTGPGTLSLAGAISIASAAFTAGIGKVVYLNLPGSNQTIAPLTYYNLVITGLGNGIKQINGAVKVIDTLTLLTDTLTINSGGSLTLSNGITIVRTAGKLLSTPIFSGIADIVYNDLLADTTGLEMPVATTVLHNLTINNLPGITLGANVTVNNNLNLQQGPLITGLFTLNNTNSLGGSTTDPGVTRTNGYVIGSINRTIGTTTGLRIFPLGISQAAYREFDINYTTAPTAGGNISVTEVDSAAPAQSGLPLTDNGVAITKVAPIYWQADAGNGLSGGKYTTTMYAGGASGVTDINTLRIVKRPSTGGAWILNGIAGTNSGTNNAPVIVRTGMSGFSQFSFGSDGSNSLPVTLISFTGQVIGKSVLLKWISSSEINNLYYTIEKSNNGISFINTGTLPSTSNSTLNQSYNFTDVNPSAGINYYRIKQTDDDGNYSYSFIINLLMNQSVSFSVFPNPAQTTINILSPGNKPLLLFDASGKYLGILFKGANNISNLSNGIYFINNGTGVISFEKR